MMRIKKKNEIDLYYILSGYYINDLVIRIVIPD